MIIVTIVEWVYKKQWSSLFSNRRRPHYVLQPASRILTFSWAAGDSVSRCDGPVHSASNSPLQHSENSFISLQNFHMNWALDFNKVFCACMKIFDGVNLRMI